MALKKINGTTYKVEPLMATKALLLQGRILKLAGAAIERLPAIFGGIDAKASDEAKAASNAASIQAFSDLFMKNDTAEIVALLADLCSVAMIERPSKDWSTVDFDGDMTDRPADVMELALFVAQEQFTSFFGASLANGALKRVLTG